MGLLRELLSDWGGRGLIRLDLRFSARRAPIPRAGLLDLVADDDEGAAFALYGRVGYVEAFEEGGEGGVFGELGLVCAHVVFERGFELGFAEGFIAIDVLDRWELLLTRKVKAG